MDQLKLTMLEVEGDLSSYQLFLLGRLDVAHSYRSFLEVKRRDSGRKKQEVMNRGMRTSTWVDDTSARIHSEDLIRTQMVHSVCSQRHVEAEKFYKKVKHELLESGVSEEVIQKFLATIPPRDQNEPRD